MTAAVGRSGLGVGTQQLGAELLARRSVASPRRRSRAPRRRRPRDRRRLRGGRAPPRRRRAPPRARRWPPASSTRRHSGAVAAGPRSRAYACTRFARSIVSSPSGAARSPATTCAAEVLRTDCVLEDAIERRDQDPPIGGWRRRQRVRERRDGATRRRLDDERARRATAREVGSDEARAEPAERGGVEQRGERRRAPRRPTRLGAGHLEEQRRIVPPEQRSRAASQALATGRPIQPTHAGVPTARTPITIRLPATPPTRLTAPVDQRRHGRPHALGKEGHEDALRRVVDRVVLQGGSRHRARLPRRGSSAGRGRPARAGR